MATEPMSESQLDPQTRARARQELHKQNAERRKHEIEQMQADFKANADNPVVVAIIEKARALSRLHLQMAKDGVGVRATGARNGEGEQESETIFFTKDKRMTELDKSAGLDELTDWIDRMLGTSPQPVFVGAQQQPANEPEPAAPPVENGPAADTTQVPPTLTGEQPNQEKAA